jgi:hypothetical protein
MTVADALEAVQFMTIDGQPMAVVHADLWQKIVAQLQDETSGLLDGLTPEQMRQEDEQRIANYRATGYGISHDGLRPTLGHRVAEWLDSIGTETELPCPQ